MDQQTSSQANAPGFINAVHGFRYQVKDVARAVAFYTQAHPCGVTFWSPSRGPWLQPQRVDER